MTALHDARVLGALVSLDSATRALVSFVGGIPDALTVAPLPGGWTPAGHVWHLAITHDVFSGALTGEGPITARPGTPDFTDAQWNFNAPPPSAAPDFLVPPRDTTAPSAVARLHESVERLRPLIQQLDAERAVETVQLPWGRVSVYQMSEWAGGHTLRHLSQVGRELHRSVLEGA